MTIECTACHARYTIADTLVPAQGARVKCKKCGEVFSIKPPAAIPAPTDVPLVPPTPEPAPQPAQETAGAPAASAPAASEAPAVPPHVPPPPVPASPAPPVPAAPEPSHATAAYERFVEPAHAGPAAAAPAPIREPAPSSPPPLPQPPPEPSAPTPPAGLAASLLSTGTPIPAGLSAEERQRHERARRLARVLASDIAIYNREKRDRGIHDGNLVAVLGYEIKKSWDIYKERVGAEFANGTPYFRDALNEIVAEGRKIF